MASLTKQLAKVGDRLLPHFMGDVPKELFHYTDVAGLLGILGSGELWATDVRCMNDSNELTLGQSLVTSALQNRSDHPAYPSMARLLEHPAYTSPPVFACSFSQRPDRLSQWRAYAADGTGFCVGFAAGALLEMDHKGKDPMQDLIKVVYDHAAQEHLAETLVSETLDVLKPLATVAAVDPQQDQLLATALAIVLSPFAVACKSNAFEEEEEVRLVVRAHQDPILPLGATPQVSAPGCSFRNGRYGITPYVRLSFSKPTVSASLSQIIIGPRSPAHDTSHMVRLLLANSGVKGWTSFPIIDAAATYR